jgi:endonuclease-3
MPTATYKQRLLNSLLALEKPLAANHGAATRSVLEQLIYGVCREGVSREKADRAFKALQTTFFDWNEVRVSAVREVEEVIVELPSAESRAERIISLLQEIFESTYSYDLESLHKKGLKQAEKQLERYQGANRFTVAYTMQQGLGGHAIPLDADMLRALRRLELLDGEPDDAAAQASLEHLVAKARGGAFCDAVSLIAQEYCWEDDPHCSTCPLHELCPTGQARLQNGTAPGRAPARSRPR